MAAAVIESKYIDPNFEKDPIGKQCVDLIHHYLLLQYRNLTPDQVNDKNWRAGKQVLSREGTEAIKYGTPIATFSEVGGKYPGAGINGYSSGIHAAIFLNFTEKGRGLVVQDQHVEPKIKKRTIHYGGLAKNVKFPTPIEMGELLKEAKRTGNRRLLPSNNAQWYFIIDIKGL